MKYQKKWLDIPSLSQGNPCGFGGDWCGRTSAAMIYNYFQKAAGKPDSALVVNDESKKDLVYPDGKVAAGGYLLSEPLEKCVKGWKRKALFPVDKRAKGVVPEQQQMEVLSPIFNSLERNVPLLFYSGISTSQSVPRHLIVICGYWSRADGVWLMIADPSVIGDAPGSASGPKKLKQLGADNLEILDTGTWQKTGCSYWIKASRLFETNESSSGAKDRRSASGAGSKAEGDGVGWDQDQDRWCDHCNRPGFVAFIHESHEVPDSSCSHAETGLFFPIGGKTAVDADAVAKYHKHVEVDYGGGYYPLGTNTVWHGGVHLHLDKGTKVHATFAGEIVAARLPDAESKAFGHYGSHNFVLVRHRRDAEVFYALYMHLNNEKLDAKNATLKDIPWLTTTKRTPGTKKPHVRIKTGLNYRSEPRVANETWKGTLKKGSAYPWLKTHSEWHRIDIDGQLMWVSAQSSYTEKVELGTPPKNEVVIDEQLLSKLRTGKVVKINRPLPCGSVLWTAGEYGSVGYRTGLLHWEVFSEKLLFPDWQQIVDNDGDFNVDSKKIIALVPQSDGYFEDDDILTSDELRKFYKESKDAKKLRQYACKFVSEWGVDLGVAIPKLKKAWYKTVGLEDKMRPYLWWDEAKAAGVPLPASKHVWHYNPIALVDALQGDTVPTSIAPSPAVEDPGEDEDPNEEEEAEELKASC